MSSRVGVFGGTFDPPHIGHLILAAEALSQLRLERVLWVLTPVPPHKLNRAVTPTALRIELVQAAIRHSPEFELSRVEIDRPGPHYALDTVRLLREQCPQADFIYLMGGDSLRDLHSWYRPREFLEMCAGLGVMRRPGDEIDLAVLDRQLPGLAEKVQMVTAPLLEISSSQVRQRAFAGMPFRYYLPLEVYEQVSALGLYQGR